MEKETKGNEIKKEYLKGYEDAVRQMKRHEERIHEIRQNRVSPTIILDGMPHAHGHNDLSSYAAILEEEERRYIKARYKRVMKCKEIMNKIERLSNEDEKDVLMYRYIRLLKWEDICERMNLSWRRIHYIHNSALENFII